MAALPQPSVLGLRPSFGFGDRLGLATPGHVDAVRNTHFQPIFAQQSIREMSRTGRTPEQVMASAQEGLVTAGWTGAWGADADHLKTEDDVYRTANAGFTFFTIDPSAYVENRADGLHGEALRVALAEVVADGAFTSVEELHDLYLGRKFDLAEDYQLGFDHAGRLHRAAVKYGRAVHYAERMAGWIGKACLGRPYEVELSVDETDSPTTPLEHLFVALELHRRQVAVTSLAPRFVGAFEKAIDYRGDVGEFEAVLYEHVAIARRLGPYKISVHSGSDKFAVYPILGRVCENLLHVKTAGTSWLEALRVVARVDPPLFTSLVAFCRGRYDEDKATYHVSADVRRLPAPEGLEPAERERVYLDGDGGRQVMHVTFGSVMAGRDERGRPFKDAILELLGDHADLHRELVARHLRRHIERLSAG